MCDFCEKMKPIMRTTFEDGPLPLKEIGHKVACK